MTSTTSPRPAAQPGGPGPAAVLAEAARLVDEVAETMWAARRGGELTATVEAVAVLRAKLDAVELAVVGELDGGVVGQAALRDAGWASVKDYLTHTAGGRKGAGPSAVRLARDLSSSRCWPRRWLPGTCRGSRRR